MTWPDDLTCNDLSLQCLDMTLTRDDHQGRRHGFFSGGGGTNHQSTV